MMRRLAALIAAGLVCAGTPVVAGSALAAPEPTPSEAAAASERINTIIVYGNDPCPQSNGDEITVCARKAEAERFRIPAPLRETPSSKSEAWTERVMAYETVGRTGTNSCSPVGPGGSTGCLQRLINNAYAEKRGASDVGFSQLIADERAKRAAKVDADAAATQARVEQAEKAYDARQRAQQDPGAAGTPPPAAPGTGDPTVSAPSAKP